MTDQSSLQSPEKQTQITLPDPLDQLDVLTSQDQANLKNVETQQFIKRRWFIFFIVAFLILTPAAVGGVFIAVRVYREVAARQDVMQPSAGTIDVSALVTPELLPEIASDSATADISGWRQYLDQEIRVRLLYPEQYFVGKVKQDVVLMSFDPSSTPELSTLYSDPAGRGVIRISAVLAGNLDSRSGATAYVLSTRENAQVEAVAEKQMIQPGYTLFTQKIRRGEVVNQEAYIYSLSDQRMVKVTLELDQAVLQPYLDRVIESVRFIRSDDSLDELSLWQTFTPRHGRYTLMYPDELVVRSDGAVEDDQIATVLFSADTLPELQKNTLSLSLFESEPPQVATLSGTRDFGNTEFRVYAGQTKISYLGVLSDGRWLEIAHQFDSQLNRRQLLEKVIDTIKLLPEN